MFDSRFAKSVAVAILVVGGVISASPASAAPTATCHLNPSTPYTDGNYAYSQIVYYCPSGQGLVANLAKATVQEKVLLVWYNRGTSAVGYSTGLSNTVVEKYYCNGAGTDSYRTRGDGTDNFYRSIVAFSSGVPITC